MKHVGCLIGVASMAWACASGSHGRGRALSDGGGVDGGFDDAGSSDAGPADSGIDAGARDAGWLTGFIFDGPLDAGAIVMGQSYTVLYADDGGVADASAASLGSPCSTGDDCAALGAGAACLASPDGGFCAVACNIEIGDSCQDGAICVTLHQDLDENEFFCVPACSPSQACANAGEQCSGPFATYSSDFAPIVEGGCFPTCATDSDCESLATGFTCDPSARRCLNPEFFVGAACTTAAADCRALGPGGSCMTSARDAGAGYCTVACDPSAATPCPAGTCVSGYATTPDGGDVDVCLGDCAETADCQADSSNTCNYFPSDEAAYCSIACASDADCPSGTCDAATGACQSTQFWAPCRADSNCALGLCVSDFHTAQFWTCSKRCTADSDCAGLGVCVTSLDSMNGAGAVMSFCAPACDLDGGAGAASCPSPSVCQAPVAQPAIDFAASGSASGDFCWQ